MIIEWINDNKEWFFSGIGVFLLTIIIGVVKMLLTRKRKNESNRIINMNGDKSVYVEKNDGKINIK